MDDDRTIFGVYGSLLSARFGFVRVVMGATTKISGGWQKLAQIGAAAQPEQIIS